ncbi:hypothetical protein GOP47_0022142 [Adiantum capillus-veneris]|uniref:Pentatricopeptide repeat-containing protein n=1 Tax=Adiantum capillus-veneris TaxID=13818 RepID=A0A9D4Z791_ADICA|nr:hypothetical protein GOP47_0022142 [Adiantum capillus-veneris]
MGCYRLWRLELLQTSKDQDRNRMSDDDKSPWLHDHSGFAQELKSSTQTKNGKLRGKQKMIAFKSTPFSYEETSAFISELRSCAKSKDLIRGIEVHDDILKRGLLEKCSDALVTMYAKCGELEKAKAVLDTINSSNVFSWTALISAYTRQGRMQDALDCFDEMLHKGLSPNAMTFTSILKACGDLKAAERGEQIHAEISRQGLLGSDDVLRNALVHMYVKCGALSKAQQILETLSSQDVCCWSALIVGYAQKGEDLQAFHCFEKMRSKGLSPDSRSLSCILKVCGSMKALNKGQEIHDEISKRGLLENDVVLGNALVGMYVKCGDLAKAQQVHEELPTRDAVSWNVLIGGFAQHGQGEQAISCFEKMQREGICPDKVTFTYILQACGSIGAADKGEQVHEMIAIQGLLENDIVLGTALVDMYANCGALAKAHQVLQELSSRDVFTWSALIAGYVKHGHGEQALQSFEQMKREGLSPDSVVLSCVLKACSIVAPLEGKKLHDEIARKGLLGKNIVLDNALIHMYVKCGVLDKAQEVLEELSCRDVVSWSTLIGGFVEHDQGAQALECYMRMQQEGVSPNAVTYACILKACGTIGAIDKGKEIHDEIVAQGLLSKHFELGTALVDMYANFGALTKAHQVLEELPFQDVGPWNVLITRYAQQGQGEKALKCFKRMQHEGIIPDAVTYLGVLNACNHLGLVEECYEQFVSMSTKFGIKLDLEHLTSMIDLFGRAGHLDKAVGVVQELQYLNDHAVWHSLLSACQKWGDISVGRWAFDRALCLDKHDSAAYVLMGSMYATAGMQEDAEYGEAMRMEN